MTTWAELDLEVPAEHVEEASALLFAMGASGVEEEYRTGEAPALRQPWDRGQAPPGPPIRVLKTWWAPADAARVGLEVGVQLAAHIVPGSTPVWREVDESQWADWHKRFKRMPIGPGWAVAPPWEAQEGDLIIEPGLAFGTGEHPTTRMCLEAILDAPRGGRCLDIGTGSGILALWAARLGYVSLGIDIDPESITTAIGNAERNGVHAAFQQGSIEDAPAEPFDLVVANLYAELLVEHHDAIAARTGGRVILSGVMADRADTVRAAFADFVQRVDRTEEGWTLLVFDRPGRGE